MTALRILVADDHEVVRRGVRVLLEAHPGWEICDEAVEGRDAVEKASRLRPEVVILDIGMPLLNGLDAARQILKASPQSEVLILTMHESEQVIREVLASGARGYVLKSDAGRNLVNAVEALSHHKTFFTSSVAEFVLQGTKSTHVRDLQHRREADLAEHRLQRRLRKELVLRAGDPGP